RKVKALVSTVIERQLLSNQPLPDRGRSDAAHLAFRWPVATRPDSSGVTLGHMRNQGCSNTEPLEFCRQPVRNAFQLQQTCGDRLEASEVLLSFRHFPVLRLGVIEPRIPVRIRHAFDSNLEDFLPARLGDGW